MKVIIRITKSFAKAAKPLLKKYPSLNKDLLQLETELIKHPRTGSSLGNNIYKIRLTISSKGKGKSGGARIISLIEAEMAGLVEIKDDNTIVNLITIYDKTDTATITDKELKELIKAFFESK